MVSFLPASGLSPLRRRKATISMLLSSTSVYSSLRFSKTNCTWHSSAKCVYHERVNQIVTSSIVLKRTNYQEADRILTLLTPDHGKVHALAKGVRKSKSKLAAGVELFSISEISFIRGKGEIATLTSARLSSHYGNIAKDINRTMLGYELIKLLDRATEDHPESDYFKLLSDTLAALDEASVNIGLIKLWFVAQLLRLSGHSPNLRTDNTGQPLIADQKYAFAFDDMVFLPGSHATYDAGHIKLLRLVFGTHTPVTLQQVQGTEQFISPCLTLAQSVLPNHIRV